MKISKMTMVLALVILPMATAGSRPIVGQELSTQSRAVGDACQAKEALLVDIFGSAVKNAAAEGCESTCTGYCGIGGCCSCFCGGFFNYCYYSCCSGSPELNSSSGLPSPSSSI